jgi:hypothetical protein
VTWRIQYWIDDLHWPADDPRLLTAVMSLSRKRSVSEVNDRFVTASVDDPDRKGSN